MFYNKNLRNWVHSDLCIQIIMWESNQQSCDKLRIPLNKLFKQTE